MIVLDASEALADTMSWENPVKSARLCFFQTGHIKEHFMQAEDPQAAHNLIEFLKENDAVIVELENFTPAEVKLIEEAKGRFGRSLFAAPDCHMKGKPGAGKRCLGICRLIHEG
jgi:hypothetical protein